MTIDGRPRKVVSAVFFKADAAAGGRIERRRGADTAARLQRGDAARPRRRLRARRRDDSRGAGTAAVRDRVADARRAVAGGRRRARRDARPGHRSHPRPLGRRRGLEAVQGPRAQRSRSEAGSGHLPPSAAASRCRRAALTERAHAQRVLLDLAKLVRRMAAVRAPRSVILISGGLAFDPRAHRLSTRSCSVPPPNRASRSTPSSLEQVGYDVSRGETRPDVADESRQGGRPRHHRLDDRRDVLSRRREGHRRVRAHPVGSQLVLSAGAREQSRRCRRQAARRQGQGQPDGPRRQGAVARRGRQALPKPRAPRDPLAAALQQPTDVPDVPLAVTTYSTHPAGSAVRLLVSAEIGAPNGAAPAEWGVRDQPARQERGHQARQDSGGVGASARDLDDRRGAARRVPSSRGRGGCGGSHRRPRDAGHRRLQTVGRRGGGRSHRRRRRGRAARAAPPHRAVGRDHRACWKSRPGPGAVTGRHRCN